MGKRFGTAVAVFSVFSLRCGLPVKETTPVAKDCRD
jgi:hypothetical protein